MASCARRHARTVTRAHASTRTHARVHQHMHTHACNPYSQVLKGYSQVLTGDSQVLTRDSRGTHGGTAKNCQQGVQPTPRRTAAVGGPVPADRSAYSLNQLRARDRRRCCVRVRVDIVRWSRSRLQCPRAFPGPRACGPAGMSAAGGAAAHRSRVAPKSAHRRLGFGIGRRHMTLLRVQCASAAVPVCQWPWAREHAASGHTYARRPGAAL
jgi:hypothetical protein